MGSGGEIGRSRSVAVVAGGGAAFALVVAVTLGVVNGGHTTSGSARPLDSSTTVPTAAATPTAGEVATAESGIGDSSALLYAVDANWRLSYDYTCSSGSGSLVVKGEASGSPTLIDVQGATGHGVVAGTPGSGEIRLEVHSLCQWKLTVLPASATQGD